ncbi:hypothetical protein Ancab_005171 [Ancistrocladus abbreviatus]
MGKALLTPLKKPPWLTTALPGPSVVSRPRPTSLLHLPLLPSASISTCPPPTPTLNTTSAGLPPAAVSSTSFNPPPPPPPPPSPSNHLHLSAANDVGLILSAAVSNPISESCSTGTATSSFLAMVNRRGLPIDLNEPPPLWL